MTELRNVKLALIDPNPFRDGSGGNPPATWKSVEEVYGFDEKKLGELQDSFRRNGVWAGAHVRPLGGRFQLAFGHHRVEAARRLGIKEIPVVVADLSDDQMLQFMASENSEEYGHDFALGVMNAVEAVVKAYGAGLVKLEKPEKQDAQRGLRMDRVKLAPSFVERAVHLDGDVRAYTADGVAKYLGWLRESARDGESASVRVLTALSALELIELGALKRNQLKGLGATQARELITLTKRAMEAEEKKHEIHQDALLERVKRAQKEGDKNTVKRVEEKLVEVSQQAARAKVAAAKQAVATVVQFHKESESFAEASRKAAEALDLKKEAKPVAQPPKKLDLSGVDDFINKLDRTLLEDDARWKKVLELAQVKAAAKTFKRLDEALERLSARAKERAKELRKVVD